MDIQPRRLVESVMAAVALMLCLGLGLIGVLIAGRGADAIQEADSADSEAQSANCQFAGVSEQLVVYQVPAPAPSQRKAVVLGGETYPIISQHNGFYLLQLADGDSGWVSSQDGTIGDNCGDIPVDDTPLADFPSVCALTNTQDITLYSEPDLINAVGTVPAGSYLVESTAGSQYYIVVDETYSGWVAASDGQIAGACDALPTAPG
jgi:hypothetical protein